MEIMSQVGAVDVILRCFSSLNSCLTDINVTKYLETQAQYPSDEDDSDNKPLRKSKSQKKPKKLVKWRNESVLCQDCGKIMRHASLQLHIDRKHRGLKGDFVCGKRF